MRAWIREGLWGPGDRLPTELELGERLGVARGTLRAAIKQLEDEGLVEELPGQGRKARGRVVRRPARSTGIMSRTCVLITSLKSVEADPLVYGEGRSEHAIDGAIVAAVHGSDMHALNLCLGAMEEQDIHRLVEEYPRGVICSHEAALSAKGQALLAKLATTPVPVVAIGNSPALASFDRVYSDHETGAYLLTRHLLSLGRRGIVQIGDAPEDLYWVIARQAGYERAMREAGLEPMPLIAVPETVIREPNQENFLTRCRQFAGFLAEPLNSGRVDAVMGINDINACLVSGAMRLLNKKPNVDAVITGYDDSRELFELQWVPGPAATIDKQNSEIGSRAVQLLLDRVGGKLPPEPQPLALQPSLVIRSV